MPEQSLPHLQPSVSPAQQRHVAGSQLGQGFSPHGEVDGIDELCVSAALWTALWLVMFYILSFTQRLWCRNAAPSTKDHENDRYWCARSVVGVIHAIFISILTVPAMVMLMAAPVQVQFGASNHLGSCRVDSMDAELLPWTLLGQVIAMAGLAFTCFTFVDIIISGAHGLASWDYMVHHVAFVSAGLLIRSHCMLPMTASVLMAMEVSTPFLNFVLFYRHRGDVYKNKVIASGVMFFITFLVFRIGINTYGTVLFWYHALRGNATPPSVPTWQVWLLVVAVTAGTGIQVFWLPSVWRNFGSRIWSLLKQGDVSTTGEQERLDDTQEFSAMDAAGSIGGKPNSVAAAS